MDEGIIAVMSLAIIAHGTNRCRSRDIWPSHSRCLTPSGWSRRSGQPCRAFRRPFRDSRPAPSTGRPRAFGSTLPPRRPFPRALLATVWPRWRDALVLVKPATVAHWRRKGFGNAGPTVAPATRKTTHRCRHSRPHWAHGDGKASLGNSPDPRGVADAGNHRPERTVSRYLPDRATGPSQTWRTFLVNHLGDLIFASSLRPSEAHDQWAVPSVPRTRLGLQNARAELYDRAFTRASSGRDPPSRELRDRP